MTKRLRGTVSTEQVADAFEVTTATVRVWVHEGKLEAMKGENGRWYISRQSMAEFARKRYGID